MSASCVTRMTVLPSLIEAFEKRHDFFAGFGIEVAGRLVGENDRGIVDQCAGDGDPLALAAGEFVRLVS